MKNKKGFTLVELLGVIVIMVLLILMAFPNFSSISNKAKSKYDNTTKVLIKSAASMYVNNNLQKVENILSGSDTTSLCIPIGTLVANEYLDSDLKNSNKENIDYRQCVYVIKEVVDNKVEYKYEVSDEDKVLEGTEYLNYLDDLDDLQ